jgi:2,3-bisphosphoglycerate-dependent phosphoglycerate mutase
MEDEVNITFLRHGRSRADDEKVHEGRYDSPLTDTGRAQVRLRAQDFRRRNIRFDRIVSSTLKRAIETATIIGQVLNVPVETDTDWMELDNGPLAGMPREVAAERYPKPDFRNPYEQIYGTGESEWEIYRRGARAVENIVRRGAGSYLVVAHGAILNAALRTIVGAPPSVNQQGILFRFGDAGYARFIYYPFKHRWYLIEFTSGNPE